MTEVEIKAVSSSAPLRRRLGGTPRLWLSSEAVALGSRDSMRNDEGELLSIEWSRRALVES